MLFSVKSIKTSIHPLVIQPEIVACIERDPLLVKGNRELIKIYEEKIKKVIERVWKGKRPDRFPLHLARLASLSTRRL